MSDAIQIHSAPFVTIKLAAAITGLTEKAINRKIESGKWIEGREFRRSPDGGLFISIEGFKKWVESGAAGSKSAKKVSASSSSGTEKPSVSASW